MARNCQQQPEANFLALVLMQVFIASFQGTRITLLEKRTGIYAGRAYHCVGRGIFKLLNVDLAKGHKHVDNVLFE